MIKKLVYRLKRRSKLKEIKQKRKDLRGLKGALVRKGAVLKFVLYDSILSIVSTLAVILFIMYNWDSIYQSYAGNLLSPDALMILKFVGISLPLLTMFLNSHSKYLEYQSCLLRENYKKITR